MKVACIQPFANSLEEYKPALNSLLNMIDEAGEQSPNLIVVPETVYPAYYLGMDNRLLDESLELTTQVVDNVAAKAKKYKSYIAFGLVEKKQESLYNSAFLFDPEGNIISKTSKSFMWHFDNNWFEQGDVYDVVDTPFGRWGMIICADGRMPELPRELALKNVDVIIDLANLTSTGKDEKLLTNAQCGFMLSTRAMENGVWVIMADKSGVESDTVTYAGRSCIISPDGEVIKEATSEKAEIIYADIDPRKSRDKRYREIHLINDRNKDSYIDLTSPLSKLPISNFVEQSIVPHQMVSQMSTTQFKYKDRNEYLEKAKRFIQKLENQQAEFIVLPQFYQGIILPHEIQEFVNNRETIVFFASKSETKGCKSISAFALTKEGILTNYRKTHLNQKEKLDHISGNEYVILETKKGNFGIMLGEEGIFPEVARILTLRGADIIIWINDLEPDIQEKIARTRSAENKVFVITSNQLNSHLHTHSFITDPNGGVISSTLSGREHATAVLIPAFLSRCKDIVPCTNAIFDRQPDQYVPLVN
ncbi:carbon-nitrogen hydrolase family protein [Salirhabdus salicampi]|uniref:carbon-nitrogen hydrolase family protein n=1 Tax=Salirhabdus salicampi TaxID=476102 RepID=UPI0020C5135A|nr:carbon-nitrogen hydrolase family protein [Salirhabdus salicampi]MCP8615261.1 carbon-nitrogen hydrolase family protein [Salirhabdus salicampi]